LLPLCLLSATGCDDRGQHPTDINKPAPDFSITDGNRTVALHDYRGKTVVLNFWATWCAPCVEEIPSLDALQRELPQIAVIGVSIDEDANAYHQFLTEHHIGFTTVREGTQRTSNLYGTFLYPETYVIDAHGMIRRKFVNSQVWTTPEIVYYLSHLANTGILPPLRRRSGSSE
jgi:cytochrome c biogenesis protein CcmG, thiol:disulfide interchange protein DsbE